MDDEAPETTATGRTDDPPRGRVWVVSDDDTDCAHPTGRLRRVGDDGINVYHRCERCGAVLVAGDGLVEAAATVGGRDGRRGPAAGDRSW